MKAPALSVLACLTLLILVPACGAQTSLLLHSEAAADLSERLGRAWNAASTDAERELVISDTHAGDYAVLDAIADAGEAIQKSGDYPAAMARFQLFLAIAARIQDDHHMATGLQLIGGLERLQGQYSDAEIHYKAALTHAEQAGDLTRAGYILNNLGSLFAAQSRFAEALDLFNRSATERAAAGIAPDASSMQNMAIIAAYQGDRARALEYFLKALAIYEAKGEKPKIALTHFNLGALNALEANYGAAEQELKLTLEIEKEVGDRTTLALTYTELGGVYESAGRSGQALDTLAKGLAMSRHIGFKQGEGLGWLALGDFHLKHHNSARAAFSYREARRIFEELHDAVNLSPVLRGLGYVAQRDRHFPLARDYAAQALVQAQAAGNPEGEWQAETLFALALRGEGDLDGARRKLERDTQLIEAQRGRVAGGDVEKQRFFEKASFPYLELASLELQQKQPLAALQSTERARARVLLDVIATGPETVDRLMSAPERAEETRLHAQLSGIGAQIGRAKPEKLPGLKEEEARRWHDFESFRAALYVSHPELRTWRGESSAISEAEIAALVPNVSTALISYVCDEGQTTVFVVTHGTEASPRVATFKLPVGRDVLAPRVEHFRGLLEGRDPGFRPEARAFYQLLVQPAAAVLRNKTRIYLVGDGPLWNLPFQALVGPSGRYWIEDAVISSTPSLTFLRDARLRSRSREAAPAVDLLAFGNPTIAGMAAIPLLAEQVTRIADLYPAGSSDLRTGNMASEAAFKREAPSARILHLATHGIVDPGNPLRSHVLLTANGKSEDGRLEAWELMRLDLKADLAVLSSCETGRGRSAQGEGMLGLSWALLVSGVPSSVVSQWRVESASTTELMVGLHRFVREKQAPAAALRHSILAVMKNERYRHPFYWGAFVSVGD